MVYYLNLGPDDLYLRPSLWNAITLGMNRELRNIGPDGVINTTGNARVGGNSGETYFGRPKAVDRPSASLAIEYYANMTNDPATRALADKVEHYYLKEAAGTKPG